ncbi:Fucoxanthin-chlorophyll a-c binding protein [Seminavis robusta]|uniref:Fucoxanthin-chlorophyll a-c binding protein n=1 Tax=Seminavis robusta TaxID=568900 RepID=A0A9N8EJR1_9STRA|nr:Fucoxanthin-chlorophyll a-c binding protein [Seminavis robusta]|eukprot:Sro1043_g234820.1 Fucoxanthin-chlorophyll a-c binding protein (210) ;mRNA; f:19932-20649
MKLAILASLLSAVAAFAPAAKQASSTVVSMSFDEELGVQAPLGFWDPFGLLNGADQERFDRLRYVEIKHGRIAQLAFLGNILPRAGVYLPGDIDYSGHAFSSYPAGIAAIKGDDAIPFEGIGQIICFIGFLEICFMKDVPGTGNEFVGDFRNGYIDFGWDTFSEEEKLSKRAIELNNGRAAQFGILGLMVHEKIVPLGYDPDLPLVGHL